MGVAEVEEGEEKATGFVVIGRENVRFLTDDEDHDVMMWIIRRGVMCCVRRRSVYYRQRV